jgi:hypothetical protein
VGEIELKAQTRNPGTVTILVAVYRGGDALRRTMHALLDQTYPLDLMDIVLMHDGTAPDVHDIIAEVSERGKCAISELVLGKCEGPASRNKALAVATGEFCGNTDDQSRQPPDWVENAIKGFDEQTAVVTGAIFATDESEARFFDVPGTRPDPDRDGALPDYLYQITNVFYRTDVALAAGGFDESFPSEASGFEAGWDTELAWRIRRLGWETRYVPQVHLFHEFPRLPRPDWVKDQMQRCEAVVQLASTTPEVRARSVFAGFFASRSTFYFDLMLAGVAGATARRKWPFLALALPWVMTAGERADLWPPKRWPSSARFLSRMTMRHAVWLVGFARASRKAKKLIL